jgi:surfactin synthase thioesterase subunit
MEALPLPAGDRGRWLVRSGSRKDARARVVCFSHAGGGASAFARWEQDLPPHVEVLAIQLPGRETRIREALRTDFDGIVRDVVERLVASPRGPTVLFGHSLGALFAFEVAHGLAAVDAGPDGLVVSAAAAPDRGRRRLDLSGLSDAALLRELSQLYGGVPSLLFEDEELTSLYARVLRADLTMLGAYQSRPRRPLECPITALYGKDDRVVTGEGLSLWAPFTRGTFRTFGLEGGHFYLQQARTSVLHHVLSLLPGPAAKESGGNSCNSGKS